MGRDVSGFKDDWFARFTTHVHWYMKNAKKHPPEAPKTVSTERRWFSRHFVIQECLFYILVFVYLWQGVGTHFIFHGAGYILNFPAFYTTWDFFERNIYQLGGVTIYASAFLSQLFYHAWLGAIVVTVQAWLFGVCLAYLLRASGIKLWRLVHFVPAFLLLAIYCRYLYFVPTTMALLLALKFACVYVYGVQHRAWLGRLIIFVALSGLCYCATGGAFLVFALVCLIYEILEGRQRLLACLYALIGSGIPYGIGAIAWGLDTSEAYTRLLPISWTLQDPIRSLGIEQVYALYVLIPGLMVAGKFWPWKNRLFVKTRLGIQSLVSLVLSVAIAVSVVCISFDAERKGQFAVDYYAAHRMWTRVIETAHKLPDDEYALHAVDRGLYHTRRLGVDLFKWPQRPNVLFLKDTRQKRAMGASYMVALEMGLLNQAEHALTECLEGWGDRPIILKHLAMVNLVKGNFGTARVYLGALSKTLFHRSWAQKSLAHLKSDPNLASHQEVQYLRSVALDVDIPTLRLSPAETMKMLLKKNPKNRMAFEYLLTYYMLNNQLESFAEYIELASDMGYSALPTHFEEAALVYVNTRRKPLRLEGLTPNAKLGQRIKHFSQILNRHQRNPVKARSELAKHYGDTYFFYNVYGPKPKHSTIGAP